MWFTLGLGRAMATKSIFSEVVAWLVLHVFCIRLHAFYRISGMLQLCFADVSFVCCVHFARAGPWRKNLIRLRCWHDLFYKCFTVVSHRFNTVSKLPRGTSLSFFVDAFVFALRSRMAMARKYTFAVDARLVLHLFHIGFTLVFHYVDISIRVHCCFACKTIVKHDPLISQAWLACCIKHM